MESQFTQGEEPAELALFTVNEQCSRPVTVELLVEGKPLSMEVDTGAAVSLMSEYIWRELFPRVKLQPCNEKFTTYTGESMQVLGEFAVNVIYEKQKPA